MIVQGIWDHNIGNSKISLVFSGAMQSPIDNKMISSSWVWYSYEKDVISLNFAYLNFDTE